jgi:hypothetical protein
MKDAMLESESQQCMDAYDATHFNTKQLKEPTELTCID